ncbi:guanylate-binding n-terminal domain containing protein [Plasmopara halstedii]|uniref:Guanylate-binding n-terminal domain containing protein n=1 Tax=Plasmopara halstedii TaxID=4781 RepID=A0A0P1APL4_PLAHL|nr:guanylate-binding n-terminal domain containing protein [Plasmopara halstedii]CEG43278.1 guanylate-binding n-terminal domain containing protein [Plasmopara halstedii]|eukprot:XP_024579647.1 guanylate-binding n-terminal domain containing protein [Plasmopara halstedii]
MSTFAEKPVPLITFDEEENKFKVNDAAVELLNCIEGHVAVIAMAGLYRTGKSSMLNWLLDRQSGFRVGPTIERCTRGIWLWGQPQRHTMADGKDVWVLMLDTEGMGGLEASQQYDARIFSLATLLCSRLIYNSHGSVDEKAISGLSFIAQLAKNIKVNATTEKGETDNEDDIMQFHSFFPSFLWVVRDFTLDLVDEDGDSITSSDYLERALADQPRTPGNMERNRIRTMMKDFFRDRDCVTLVRPVHDESKLQQVDALPIEDLRPEFQQQLRDVKQIVYGNSLKPKMLQGKPLNGRMFAGLLKAYVAAINSGGVPVITSAWEGVTASECRKALTTAADTFKLSLAALELPLDDKDLIEAIKDAEKRAIAQYRAAAIGDSASSLEAELRNRMENEKDDCARNNAERSKEMCDRLLHILYAEEIQPKLAAANDESDEMLRFSLNWQAFRDLYLKKARGSAKLECLLTFSESKYAEAMRILLSRQEESYEKKIRKLQGDVSKVKEELGNVGGREQIYMDQIEQMQVQSSQILSERAFFEAEAEAQRERVANLESIVHDEVDSEQHVQTVHDSANTKRSSEVKNRENDSELERMKAAYERVVQEKERQEMELNLLSEECQQLRKGHACACTIS